MKLNVISGRVPAGSDTYMPEMTRAGVETFMQSHPLMQFLEFYDMVGDAAYVQRGSDASGGVGRAKGTDFSAGTESGDWGTPALKIFGDSKVIDQAEQRRGKNLADFANRMLTSLARYQAWNFAEKFVSGATSTSMWDGIAALCQAGQKVTLAAAGQAIPAGNSDANRALQQAFFEALDVAISYCLGGPQVILMNSKLVSRITNVYKEAFTVPEDQQQVGVKIPFYNGIPIVPMGRNASGTEILPWTETQGASTTCSSIYILSLGEADQVSVGTNTGFNAYLSKASEKYRVTFEGDFVPTLFHNKCISALIGTKL
jgi:hypothetical protein